MCATYLFMHLRKEDLVGRATVAVPCGPCAMGAPVIHDHVPPVHSTGGRFYQLIIDTAGSYKGEMDSDITMLEKEQGTR